MANFTRVKPGGWNLFDLLASALMNALDIDHAKAINGDDGSTHAPLAQIVLGGAGLRVSGPMVFDVGSDPHFVNGLVGHIDNGASIHVEGLQGIRVSSGGSIHFDSGSFLIGQPQIGMSGAAGSSLNLSTTGELQTNLITAIGATPTIAGAWTFSGVVQRASGGRLPFRRTSVSTSTPQTLTLANEAFRVPTSLPADQLLQLVDGTEDGDWAIFYRNGSPNAHKCDLSIGVTNPQSFTMPNSTACWCLFFWNQSAVAWELSAGTASVFGI